MKNFLHTVLIMLPMLLVAQTPQGISYQAVAYDANGFELANQEISIRLSVLLETTDAESSYSETHQITTNDFGLFSLLISQGNSTDDFSDLNWENGAFLKIELDANLDGNYTLMGINSFSSVPYSLHSTFAENIPTYYSDEIEGLVSEIDSLESIVSVVSQYFGCKDHDACNYDVTATMSDNTCTYAQEGYYCSGECIDTDTDGVCDLDEVEGCTDATACNYVLGATNEDGSCQYNEEYYNCQGTCENDDDGDGTCDELEEGCTDETADNYNPQALNSTNCIYMGCMDNTSGNYNPMANQDDGSCIPAEACPYPEYLEYDSTAASYNANLCVNFIVEGCTDNTALNYNSDANVDDNSCEFIYGCIDQEADNYNVEASTDDGSCIYYGCTDITAGNYDETANSNDGSCLVSGCIIELAENYNPEAKINDGSCIVYGCLLEDFPNYNEWANVDNGSCDMNSNDVYGCTEPNAYSYNPNANIDNGDCYMLHIGQHVYGGIVFYLDETGQRGLVSAIEDLPGYYEWGCYQEEVVGANEHSIGTGYQNTMDIVNQGCSTENGGITAAQAALNAEIIDYNDWYLPSFDELYEMYNTIGYGGPEGNIGGFVENGEYWSSSECGSTGAMRIYFGAGYYGCYGKNFSTFRVRPIRSFQHSLISGCTDPSACNYNSEANMADETCIYPEQGYDCDGNSPEIGGLFFGGILFYIDSTGQHGLVAAMEDLTDTYEWGCYGTDINGNNSSVSPELVGIGTGLQNTLEIVSGCSETPIAASEALAYVSEEGYSDWFLPSFDELVEMYNTIGNGGPEGNIGGFSNSLYWSSSEYDSSFAWFVHFDAGGAYYYTKASPSRVRVIRAF